MSDNANEIALPSSSNSDNNKNKNNKDSEAGHKELQTGQFSENRGRQSGSRIPDSDGDINIQEDHPVTQPHDRKRPRDTSEADGVPAKKKFTRKCGRVGSIPAAKAPVKFMAREALLNKLRRKEPVKNLVKDSEVVVEDNETDSILMLYNLERKPEAAMASIMQRPRMRGASVDYLAVGTLPGNAVPGMPFISSPPKR